MGCCLRIFIKVKQHNMDYTTKRKRKYSHFSKYSMFGTCCLRYIEFWKAFMSEALFVILLRNNSVKLDKLLLMTSRCCECFVGSVLNVF